MPCWAARIAAGTLVLGTVLAAQAGAAVAAEERLPAEKQALPTDKLREVLKSLAEKRRDRLAECVTMLERQAAPAPPGREAEHARLGLQIAAHCRNVTRRADDFDRRYGPFMRGETDVPPE